MTNVNKNNYVLKSLEGMLNEVKNEFMESKGYDNFVINLFRKELGLNITMISFYKHPEDPSFDDIYLDQIQTDSGLSLNGSENGSEDEILEISKSSYYEEGQTLESFYEKITPICIDLAKDNIVFIDPEDFEPHFYLDEDTYEKSNEDFVSEKEASLYFLKFLKSKIKSLESKLEEMEGDF